MAQAYLHQLVTPSVAAAQIRYYGQAMTIAGAPASDPLGEEEKAFIEERDSFYMATISGNGWPYIQHRGGRRGFLRVLGPSLLGFADFGGNRQMITTGNLSEHDRVSLFFMDYPRRARLKLLGRARVIDAREHPEWAAQLSGTETRHKAERLVLIEVVSFDWNCPKHITPRYTAEDVEKVLTPLKLRIAELEQQIRNASIS